MNVQKKIILVTGANGQLGMELRTVADQFPEFEFLFTAREELSVIDPNAVNEIFEKYYPHYCINCAAYTAVDKAEEPSELEPVTLLNADAVGFLAKNCNQYQTKLIHISTDYVFEGISSNPYEETDSTHPATVYGSTKLKGERLALEYSDAIVVRTSWVYSYYGKNFVKTMIRLMSEGPEINVVNDQVGSPTYANDLAKALLTIISSGKWHGGIYHYANEGKVSWYQFALAIKELIKSNCRVNPIPSSAYPTPAKRPAWSVLNCNKIKDTYPLMIPNWKDSLEKCIGLLVPSK